MLGLHHLQNIQLPHLKEFTLVSLLFDLTYHTMIVLTASGCVRATPFGFMKVKEEPEPSRRLMRTSSLPDSMLWDMGRSYSMCDAYIHCTTHT